MLFKQSKLLRVRSGLEIGNRYHYSEYDMRKISSQLHFSEVLHKQLQLPSLSQADSCQLQGAQAVKDLGEDKGGTED